MQHVINQLVPSSASYPGWTLTVLTCTNAATLRSSLRCLSFLLENEERGLDYRPDCCSSETPMVNYVTKSNPCPACKPAEISIFMASS